MPEEAFRKGRSGVLRSVLDQDVIYHTAEVSERLEMSARNNLKRALAELPED